MELNDVYSVIERFEKSSLSELQIEMQDLKLVLKRELTVTSSAQPVIAQTKVVQEDNVQEVVASKNALAADEVYIKAPLVGTFYRAESPDAKPYVQVGDIVKKGTVVGLIEAMKLMNEITSPEDGIVTEIIAGNAELVSYDQCLIKIKKSV